MKICILQTDDRPSLNYFKLTEYVNNVVVTRLSTEFNIIYKFILNTTDEINVHGATRKILTLLNFMNSNKDIDIIIFLDTDAWVQDKNNLSQLLYYLQDNSDIQGMFSRDPYYDINTFINSGSFIIRNNTFTRSLWSEMKEYMLSDNRFHNQWPYDQWYISEIIYRNRNSFLIFKPEVLNTPIGNTIRHNWYKSERLYTDIDKLVKSNCDGEIKRLNIKSLLDTEPFPNKNKNDDYYFRV